MKVWNIRYCLTAGITHVEVLGTSEDKYVYTKDRWSVQLKLNVNAFEDYRAAFAAAEKMRKRKITALMKQIEALEKLQFGVTKPEEDDG